MFKIFSNNKFHMLSLLVSFLFCSISQAADTNTVIFDGITYQVSENYDVMSFWLSRGEKNTVKTIYTTGIDGVYCSSPIYQDLLARMTGCSTVELPLQYRTT